MPGSWAMPPVVSVFVVSGPSWTSTRRPTSRSVSVPVERSNQISPRLGGHEPSSGVTRSIRWAVKSGRAVSWSSIDSSGPVTRRAVALRRPWASATPGIRRTVSTRSLSNGTVVNRLAELGWVAAYPSRRFASSSALAPAIVPTAVTPTAIDTTTSTLRIRCSNRSRQTFRHRTEPRASTDTQPPGVPGHVTGGPPGV